jgi:hypothetical protein
MRVLNTAAWSKFLHADGVLCYIASLTKGTGEVGFMLMLASLDDVVWCSGGIAPGIYRVYTKEWCGFRS